MTETAPATAIEVEKPDPLLIQQLFDEDPLKLTDQNIDSIIAWYRAERVDYLQPKPVKTTKGKAKAVDSGKEPELPLSANIDLGDLGLDL